jgi:phosphoadenosine phosphosulfate reductase
MEKIPEEEIVQAAELLESKNAEEILRWGLERFQSIGFASSFSAEDVVMIDLLAQTDPQHRVRVFTLDTGRLPEETYEVMDRIRETYGIAIASYFPNREAVEKLEREKGFHSFRESVENREECCGIRKVEPLNRALAGLEAWVTGLRREQAVTRTALPKVKRDSVHGGRVKLNPLADWTTSRVWDYIREHHVPYNRLHDMNFPSIGCAPCTRAIRPGEDIRAGRWWWESPEYKECGLHKPKE